MIPNPDTLAMIREMAEHAASTALDSPRERGEFRSILKAIYLRGADAGYIAAKAEERQP